jgi:hypothetical protein
MRKRTDEGGAEASHGGCVERILARRAAHAVGAKQAGGCGIARARPAVSLCHE